MKILIVDDDRNLNRGISTFLTTNHFESLSAYNGEEGLEILDKEKIDLVISDLQMPKLDGIGLLEKLNKKKLGTPVIIMTAFASVENAVEAMRKGADDYLTKPINLKELLIKIEKIKKTQDLWRENRELRKCITEYQMPEIIGESEPIQELKEMLRRITNDHDVPILIYGKSGTGKELVARNVHFMSGRGDKPFVPINCAVLSEELMESELFGHEKGAFTSATNAKIGLLEKSSGGTIFLDEVSEMSPRVQSKLLRVLQDGIIQPVGSNEMKKTDIRFICASNKKLSELVEEKKFRDDLFYRLNVIELEVPSLAARKNDIPMLVKHFFTKYNQPEIAFSDEALDILGKYLWPGNIRELENLIRMLIVTTNNSLIQINDLPSKYKTALKKMESKNILINEDFKIAYNQSIINFEKTYLEYHLKNNKFNISSTAEAINLSRVSLHKKIKEYSILLK